MWPNLGRFTSLDSRRCCRLQAMMHCKQAFVTDGRRVVLHCPPQLHVFQTAVRGEANVLRDQIKLKNKKAISFKCTKWEVATDDVRKNRMFRDEPRLKGYSDLSVFKGGYKEKSDENRDSKRNNVNVVGDIELSDDEILILGNNHMYICISPEIFKM